MKEYIIEEFAKIGFEIDDIAADKFLTKSLILLL